MAKKIYANVNNFLHKAKKIYVNQNGELKKVKKAYVNVAGTLRPCYTTELTYIGIRDKLECTRTDLASGTIGNYAVFAGGSGPNQSYLTEVSAHNNELIEEKTIEPLTQGTYDLAATTIGEYILFGGGTLGGGKGKNIIEVYNIGLSKESNIMVTGYSIPWSQRLSAVSTNKYAIFAGGKNYSDHLDTIVIYDKNLSKITDINLKLSESKCDLAAESSQESTMFAGGYGTVYRDNPDYTMTGYSNHVDIFCFDGTTITTSTRQLKERRSSLASASIDKYILFGGGSIGGTISSSSSALDIYENTGTKIVNDVKNLSQARSGLAATTLGDYIIFGGGYNKDDKTAGAQAIDIYEGLTKIADKNYKFEQGVLSGSTATTIGDYALFGGNYDTTDAKYYMEVFMI